MEIEHFMILSNTSLQSRLLESLQFYREGLIDLEALSKSVFLNGRALEKMPYPLVKEIAAIGYELENLECYVNNDFDADADIEKVLSKLEVCLKAIPTEH